MAVDFFAQRGDAAQRGGVLGILLKRAEGRRQDVPHQRPHLTPLMSDDAPQHATKTVHEVAVHCGLLLLLLL